MNNHTVLIGLTFILMTLTACQPVAQAAALPPSASQPTAIQDPLLLEAWSRLDNHTEPITLWDGSSLSGHALAQFVLEHHIPIVWGSENICGGSSCSRQYCQGDLCDFDDGRPGVDPIYIRPLPQDKGEVKIDDLVDTLAHEIYHRTQPNGTVKDTLYEEYSANYAGAAISQKYWTNFEDYNPLQPACLEQWFYDHHLLNGYKGLDAYPQAVLTKVDTSSTTCSPKGKRISQAAPNNLLTCTINMDGSANCQFPPEPTPAPEYRLVCTTYPGGLKGCETIWLNNPQATASAP